MNWMFTDMDAYFASVEQYLRPELRGRPVGIIPVETESTCVIAASYDAKRLGVKVGTGVREARQLCPGIKLVKARPNIYVQMHHRILQSVDRCAEVQRVYSIDEWSVQLRGDHRCAEQARKIAQDTKWQLHEDFGPWLTCSIGIAPTRLLAKIASDLQKPDGLTVLPISDLPDRLESLSLKDLCGISDGMLARLERHGVRNVRALWEVSREQAVRIWGSILGAQWWAGFHGHDEPEPATRRRSMSHGNVLAPHLRNEAGACGILTVLVCKLAQRLRRSGYFAEKLRISLTDVAGRHVSDEIGLPCVNDTPTLLQQFHKLWERCLPHDFPIKKVDVSVTGLVLATQVARPLFEETDKLQRLSQALDEINDRWGTSTAYFGSMHDYREPLENKIAFGRIPDGFE
ncbi:MAG: type VI secretion protein ImpB [Planctomycetia bacterium]|nr:type VI secretion protein ImpB [Planctomycetia bacterium]